MVVLWALPFQELCEAALQDDDAVHAAATSVSAAFEVSCVQLVLMALCVLGFCSVSAARSAASVVRLAPAAEPP